MTRPPYNDARRVFWIVDNCSAHRGSKAVERCGASTLARPSCTLRFPKSFDTLIIQDFILEHTVDRSSEYTQLL
jgi:hypothetical protein